MNDRNRTYTKAEEDDLRRRAIVFFDKTQAATSYPATIMGRMTLAGKVAAGVEPSEIIAKELSLGGVQHPIHPGLLGEDAIEWFRFAEFCGWLIEGPSEAVEPRCFHIKNMDNKI